MSSSNTPLNLYLGQSSLSGCETNDDNKQELLNIKNYIIQQNMNLNVANKELTIENVKLSKTLDEKEDEIDNFETQLRYIKGELKNFIQLRENAEYITKLTIMKEKNITELLNNYNSLFLYMTIFLLVYKLLSLTVSFVLNYNNMFDFYNSVSLECMTFISIFYLPEMLFKKYSYFYLKLNTLKKQNWSLNEEIKNKKDDNKQIEDSNDFISKYIDNI